MAVDPSPGNPPQLPPRYQPRALVKESSSTLVYRVFDTLEKRDAALKILRREISEPAELARFRSEFSTLASLDHPNIVKV